MAEEFITPENLARIQAEAATVPGQNVFCFDSNGAGNRASVPTAAEPLMAGEPAGFVFEDKRPAWEQVEAAKADLLTQNLPEPAAEVSAAGRKLAFDMLAELHRELNPTDNEARTGNRLTRAVSTFFSGSPAKPQIQPKNLSQQLLGQSELFERLRSEIEQVLAEEKEVDVLTLQKYKAALLTAHLIGQNGIQNRRSGQVDLITYTQILRNWSGTGGGMTLSALLGSRYDQLVGIIKT